MPRKKPAPTYISSGAPIEILSMRNWWGVVNHCISIIQDVDRQIPMVDSVGSPPVESLTITHLDGYYDVVHKVYVDNPTRVRSGYKASVDYLVLDPAEHFPVYHISGEWIEAYAWAMQMVVAASLMNQGNTYATVDIVGARGHIGGILTDVLRHGSSQLTLIDRDNTTNEFNAELVMFATDHHTPLVNRSDPHKKYVVGGGRAFHGHHPDCRIGAASLGGPRSKDDGEAYYIRIAATMREMIVVDGEAEKLNVYYCSGNNPFEPLVLSWFLNQYEGRL